MRAISLHSHQLEWTFMRESESAIEMASGRELSNAHLRFLRRFPGKGRMRGAKADSICRIFSTLARNQDLTTLFVPMRVILAKTIVKINLTDRRSASFVQRRNHETKPARIKDRFRPEE